MLLETARKPAVVGAEDLGGRALRRVREGQECEDVRGGLKSEGGGALSLGGEARGRGRGGAAAAAVARRSS
jgi:hypothetical protein